MMYMVYEQLYTWVGGLRTMEFPAIRAGAIFETARLTGQLKGGMAKTTPSGICTHKIFL